MHFKPPALLLLAVPALAAPGTSTAAVLSPFDQLLQEYVNLQIKRRFTHGFDLRDPKSKKIPVEISNMIFEADACAGGLD